MIRDGPITNHEPRTMAPKRLMQAAWIAPMDQPPVREGALVVETGRILAAGPAGQLRAAHPDAVVEELGDVILLPGLINAHTHLEWSDQPCGPAPERGLIEWLNRRRQPRTDASVERAVALGVDQCLVFGVTTVGDISKFHHASRPALARSGIRAVSYGEVVALGRKRADLEPRLAAAVDRSAATGRLKIGLSPHAPYTVEAAGYARCLAVAGERGLALATHLAESEHETPLLADHAGAFRELWERIGLWDAPPTRFPGGPIRFAQSLGLLDYPTLLAHVNYCDDDELALLACGRASVVYCPRTHAYFGHPPHRWRDMLRAGVNVAVGTDSCASSPDLNLVDDLRLLHRLAPDASPHILWEMATLRAARALQLDAEIGSLTPGKQADIVAFPARGPDPLRAILRDPVLPSAVWINGQKHPR